MSKWGALLSVYLLLRLSCAAVYQFLSSALQQGMQISTWRFSQSWAADFWEDPYSLRKSNCLLPLSGSSKLKVARNETLFPKMWWFFFWSNYHWSYADKGQQKLCVVFWMKYCTRVGLKIGTQTKKSSKKHPCFSLQTAKSAVNWCFVAVFSYWYWVHL